VCPYKGHISNSYFDNYYDNKSLLIMMAIADLRVRSGVTHALEDDNRGEDKMSQYENSSLSRLLKLRRSALLASAGGLGLLHWYQEPASINLCRSSEFRQRLPPRARCSPRALRIW
jgi:hypothetical protein